MPLPKDDEVRFLFGCETDLDSSYQVGLPKERWKDFGFIIISTTHFHHMTGPEWENCTNQTRAILWVKRLEAVLNMDLPFHKVGIAHLACGLIDIKSRENYLEVLNLIPKKDLQRLFTKAAQLGVGIELNSADVGCSDEEIDTVFRMFYIAKECGCKFYLGSDAHERWAFKDVDVAFERAINLLNLQEEDKFVL